MKSPSNEPIRLTESQTEMLTRALTEAIQEAAIPKSSETEFIKKPAIVKPLRPAAKPLNKTTIV